MLHVAGEIVALPAIRNLPGTTAASTGLLAHSQDFVLGWELSVLDRHTAT